MGEAAAFSNPLPRDGLLADYRPPAGVFDEMVTPTGSLRTPWEQFIGGVNRAGAGGLAQRSEQVKRLLRESGVTYNVVGAPQGPDRPWELDPLPMLFEKRAWETLAEALIQRATLLNLILADVYGPQRLVSEGVLPPAVVFDHPGYLLPCHGIRLPDDAYLCLYAAHLARQPDGQWMVLNDRTQGPSGTGYTLENRIAVSRTLRNDFETLHIERLAPFFIALQERLFSLAPKQRENPRVVLLSPGISSPTFFEDGYMARYLGYTQVEGGDLTVRGNCVYLKTLGGLLPVDVILRRIPDRDCDPLELEGNSPFGTAGLVQALRDGEVVIANAVGSGFLEAPVLAAFLPAACRLLLQQDLQCPSLPTWWCGDAESMNYVESNLSQLIVRHAFKRRTAPPIAGGELTDDQQRQLIEQMRRRPEHFIAQMPVERSTTPVWNGHAVQPWRVELRTFAVAAKDGYQIMPGGLARLFESPQTIGESMAAGQSSKDVWVLSDAPVEPVTLLKQPSKLIELRRSPADVPSRTADNLFWLGRHAERAEAMVRHLRSCIVRLTSDLEPTGLAELFDLVAALTDVPGAAALPSFGPERNTEVVSSLRQEVIRWLFDAQRPGALAYTLEALHSKASQVRDRLSVDGWRIVNQMNLTALFPWEPQPSRLGDLVLLLNQVLNLLAALSGLGTESMTRGLGWRFLDMGRRIERALQTLRLFRRTLVSATAETTPLFEAILEICDSSMTYRYRYRSTLQLAPVLDLLLIDDSNPRAVGYQLNSLSEHVAVLPVMVGDPVHSAEQQTMMTAQATVRLTDVEALCTADQFGQRDRLEALLEQLEDQLRSLSDEITHHYLTHTGPARQLRLVAAGRFDTLRMDGTHSK
ncbi:MAG TPA: circularly permuted type 2 ATP-grasp protein [Pirellulales bacterium]|nr:circularly permuted type 2 ATP-grasp protein [Pirellulales bacterium]